MAWLALKGGGGGGGGADAYAQPASVVGYAMQVINKFYATYSGCPGSSPMALWVMYSTAL